MLQITIGSFLILLSLAACNGGGGSSNGTTGSTSPQTPEQIAKEHEERASDFITKLNKALGAGQLDAYTAAKVHTLEDGYIVVRSVEAPSTPWGQSKTLYTAYYVGDWNGFYQNNDRHTDYTIQRYFDENIAKFRYDLRPQGDGTFLDVGTGALFTKDATSSKNLSKNKAFLQMIQINTISEALRANYGLSAKSSVDLARLTYLVSSSQSGTFRIKDYDAFMKEIAGVALTDIQSTIEKGNVEDISKMLQSAADNVGTDPESLNQFVIDYFSF